MGRQMNWWRSLRKRLHRHRWERFIGYDPSPKTYSQWGYCAGCGRTYQVGPAWYIHMKDPTK